MNSGIYKITNIINNKFYIGSSVNVNRRMKDHLSLLKNNKHYNTHLQRSWNKYGECNFNFEKIDDCEQEFLFKKEKKYIDELNPHYNIDKIGETLTRICSLETRKRMSENAKKRSWSREVRNKMSQSRRNSPKAILAGKNNKEKRSIKIEVLNINGITIIYSSMKEAANKLNLPHSSISKYTNKDKFYRGLYKFFKVI